MTRTISRLFDDKADAEQAVRELEGFDIPHSDLSLTRTPTAADEDHFRSDDSLQRGRMRDTVDAVDAPNPNHDGDISRGASTGAVLGGVGGLLAGIGLLAIPGLGPVVAAGWLASTAVGAGLGAAGGGATGTIVGLLKSEGHSDDDAQILSESVRRGSVLVSARVSDQMAEQVDAILKSYGGVDAQTRGQVYRDSGWTGFDESVPPYADDARMAQRDWEAGRGTRF